MQNHNDKYTAYNHNLSFKQNTTGDWVEAFQWIACPNICMFFVQFVQN